MISRHGRGDGGWFSESVEEELRAFLLAAAWETVQRSQAKDDGRGSNRLAGWVVWVLHRRVVDFLRDQFGTKRHGVPRPEMVQFNEQEHTAPSYDDYPHENNGRHIDRSGLSARAADELALLELAAETGESRTVIARTLGLSPSEEHLRREAVIADQGVRP